MQDSSRLVGSDLPFPIPFPPSSATPTGGTTARSFWTTISSTSTSFTGLKNPAVFCDDFCVETRDVETYHTGLYKYLVASPAGLQKVLNSERLPALYIEGQVAGCGSVGSANNFGCGGETDH